MPKRRPKRRNPVARQLRTPVFRKRVVRSRKIYRRKGRPNERERGDDLRHGE